MDDFRLGSIAPSDPYRDQGSGSSNRKKGKRRPLSSEEPVAQEDEFVTSPEQTEASEEAVEDSYSPSHSPEEPE